MSFKNKTYVTSQLKFDMIILRLPCDSGNLAAAGQCFVQLDALFKNSFCLSCWLILPSDTFIFIPLFDFPPSSQYIFHCPASVLLKGVHFLSICSLCSTVTCLCHLILLIYSNTLWPQFSSFSCSQGTDAVLNWHVLAKRGETHNTNTAQFTQQKENNMEKLWM